MKKRPLFLCLTFLLVASVFNFSPAFSLAAETPQQQVDAMITRAYRMTLNRFPDQVGLTTFEKAFYTGTLNNYKSPRAGGEPVTIQNLTQAYGNLVLLLRASEEYKTFIANNNGSSPEIIRIYRDVLDRDPDATGST